MSEPSLPGRFRLWIFDAAETLRRTTVPGQPCPRGPAEWELLPGVRRRLGAIPWNWPGGPYLGLASNQDQVAYGHLALSTAVRLLDDLAVAATGTVLPRPALQLCPHALAAGCECRKPGAAMLRRIMTFYRVSPAETIFVGNSEVDRRAAEAAGVSFLAAGELFGWAQTA
jgi:D-glycero-D-manno-heptose 1,7-bisphosphate phosphatase